jgi:uncharacterized membrane protein
MDLYLFVKWIHVLSSTILFGFGLGSAWYLWRAHRTRDPRTIAGVARMVVNADWIFTGTSGVAQPLSGVALAHLAGWPLSAPWLVAAYCLYLLAFLCWAPVVWLQMRAHRLARQAAENNSALPPEYFRVMRRWFLLGWPAFLSLLAAFWLMIAKPTLW